MNKSSDGIGRPRQVPIREVWEKEATDFTPWLAQEEKFRWLADALNFEHGHVEKEQRKVGRFYADIVARDFQGRAVLVECQLDSSDHDHLGKTLTYLAGLGELTAKIVWLAEEIKEEHRAAIEWLNAETSSNFEFFAVEMSALQIEDSKPAPQFRVVSHPETWERPSGNKPKRKTGGPISKEEKLHREFWSGLARYIDEQDPRFRQQAPPITGEWHFPANAAHAHFSLIVNMSTRSICAGLTMFDGPAKTTYRRLLSSQQALEKEFGADLQWDLLEGQRESRILICRPDIAQIEEGNWDNLWPWYWEHLKKIRATFSARLREIDATS